MTLSSLCDLQTRARQTLERLKAGPEPVIWVSSATCALSAGGAEVRDAVEAELQALGIAAKIVPVGCMAPCYLEPLLDIQKPGGPRIRYGGMTPQRARELLRASLLDGNVRADLATGVIGEAGCEGIAPLTDNPMLKRQARIVSRNLGLISPEELDHSIAAGGYQGLAKALEMTPEQVIAQVTASGLRGRGGGGFPTGRKWRVAREASGETKYVICNGDEGGPGAFMDRAVLEGDPHGAIEGLIIAGYAIGASKGYVHTRAEYPIAIARLTRALQQLREVGLLGEDILGSGFSFDIEIVQAAGAFVCGEESALLETLEGRRGMPRTKPPYPATKGLWGQPTVINNVETLANVPLIIDRGAEWFAGCGTETSKGTKMFALGGSLNRTGLIEVPLGTTLGEVVFDIGGGVAKGRHLKAVQVGGPTGGCLPVELLNLPLDYESVTEAGAIIGSGALVALDDHTCAVDIARYFVDFSHQESCGKCAPCRLGTKQMLMILEAICAGRGRPGDIEQLAAIAEATAGSSLCGLGRTAANPVITTIRYFRPEYEEHVFASRCRAGACSDLVRAPCENACPAGVDVPSYVNLIGQGRLQEAHAIVREAIPFPSVCGRVCTAYCESHCRRADLDSPLAIRLLKRAATEYGAAEWAPALPEPIGKQVAVVGAGPAGLTAAEDLARLGYSVTILEKEHTPGGMMALAIPEYRLPREVLQREISDVLKLGVRLTTGVTFGKDVTVQDLREQGFDAVILAIGCQAESPLGVPGAEAEAVLGALAFLKRVALHQPAGIGKRVAVVGGGDTAIDAARTALRVGAEHVHLVYRRTRAEMPAHPEEIEEAQREGIVFHMLVAPKAVIVRDGTVAGLQCQKMQLGEWDRSGRRRPVPIPGEEYVIEVDTVISAIGQTVDHQCPGVEVNRGKIQVDPVTLNTNMPGVFACGDATEGPMTVIDAIADGHRVALAVHSYLSGQPLAAPRPRSKTAVGAEEMSQLEDLLTDDTPRSEAAKVPVHERRFGFAEVELGFSVPVACREASRCQRCHYVLREEEPAAAK